jgi:hypothetical protein
MTKTKTNEHSSPPGRPPCGDGRGGRDGNYSPTVAFLEKVDEALAAMDVAIVKAMALQVTIRYPIKKHIGESFFKKQSTGRKIQSLSKSLKS